MKIAVTSPSFCKDPELVSQLQAIAPGAKLNKEGRYFQEHELLEFLAGIDAAIVGTDKIHAGILEHLPDLKFISKYGVGLDNLDQDAIRSRNIGIGWTGGTNKRSVSELALCYMLGLARNIFFTTRKLQTGTWYKDGGFQLTGKTVGVIGCGHIGTDLIGLLQPFQCNILINDIIDKSETAQSFAARQVDFETILTESDFITIHTPLDGSTRNLISTPELHKMKKGSYLINSARGGIVDEDALKRELQKPAGERNLAGAALDAYVREPVDDPELFALENLVMTPHIGGNAREAVLAMGNSAIEHLADYLSTYRQNSA